MMQTERDKAQTIRQIKLMLNRPAGRLELVEKDSVLYSHLSRIAFASFCRPVYFCGLRMDCIADMALFIAEQYRIDFSRQHPDIAKIAPPVFAQGLCFFPPVKLSHIAEALATSTGAPLSWLILKMIATGHMDVECSTNIRRIMEAVRKRPSLRNGWFNENTAYWQVIRRFRKSVSGQDFLSFSADMELMSVVFRQTPDELNRYVEHADSIKAVSFLPQEYFAGVRTIETCPGSLVIGSGYRQNTYEPYRALKSRNLGLKTLNEGYLRDLKSADSRLVLDSGDGVKAVMEGITAGTM